MKALILAGGMGVRLRPITDTRPKPLIPILCRPILDWHLSNLSRINVIDSIRIVVSYMKEKIQSFVENRGYGVQYEFIDQVEELGTGDAVIKGVKGLGYDDEILIVYGDVYLSDLSIIEKIASMDGNVVLGARVGDPEKYGVLIVENGFLKRIEEKPVNPPSNLVFTGISKLKVGDVIEHSDIGFSVRGEMEFTDILTRIANSKQLRVIEIDGENWVDIGYPWNVIEANKLALKSIGRDIRG
ncbi:MAG: sugar phosphate nucleotidyltransferase, partial [Desulfurococcaceae archaeon]